MCSTLLASEFSGDLRLLLGKEHLERLIDDLGHGRTVEIGLPAKGLEPALFDIKGDALHLAARLLGVLPTFTLVSSPVDQLAEIVKHRRRDPWVAMRSTCGRVHRRRQPELFEALGNGGYGEVQQAGHGALGKSLRVEVAEEGLVVSVTCHQSVSCCESGRICA